MLENISIEEHQTMFYTYEISPIFLAERKRLPFPLLEQLIRNYLNTGPDRDICLRFDYEFDEFFDYFKDKKDILYRISELSGEGMFLKLDKYFKAVINKYKKIDNYNGDKYIYLIVETDFNEQIIEFIKNKKIEYVFIKDECNANLDEVIKSTYLKFLFDKSFKKVFF